jgi:IS605 family transposase
MSPKTIVSRTYPRVPYAAFDKDGEPLGLDDVLDGIRKDAELVARYALKEMTEQNLALVTYFDGLKPSGAGYMMGLKLPAEVKKQFKSGSSRLERMFREQVVTNLRSWTTRVEVMTQTYPKYVSAGWRRTASDSKPTSLQPRLSLSSTDNHYRKMSVTPERVSLDMVIQGSWVTLHFPTPPQLLEKGCEPGVPDIWIDDQNRAMFGFHGKTNPGRPEFSERYVVGVDLGVTNPAAYVVWDAEKKEIVEKSLLGQRARSLNNKIKRTKNQVASLKRKGKDEEAVSHREHLSNRRLELSIFIAQELADVSWRYGNAIVSFEDLSHIKNTMKHGRWFRGEVYRRTRDMVEADGGRVMKVNAAYTSKRCHVCQSDLDMSNYSSPVCDTCGITHHRDLNAAANIAQRANVKKACQTRKRHATKTKRVRRSKCHVKTLKHPGTKNRPTPKAPQNQKKSKSNARTYPPLPSKEVSKEMCPADIRVSAVDHTWFQTTSGTTVPKENLSIVNTVDVVYTKE